MAAAVSISGPAHRMSRARIARIAPDLVEVTRQVSAELGYARQDEDIADAKTGRSRDRVEQQRCALWDLRHAQPRLVERARRIMRLEDALRLRVQDQRDTKRLGDAGRGDIVMRRPDAAGRENIIESRAHFVDGVDDRRDVVGNDPRLAQSDADIVEALRQDLAAIRTGRASSALVERIQVDYYGAPTPINQVAQISVPEARLIIIQPYERRLLADIEKAIQKSDLGVNPNNDGQVIRLNIPPLNEERRRDMVKMLHKKLDEHKVAVRNIRRDTQDKLQDREKKKEISEDELKRSKDRLQKLTDKYIDEMDKVGKTKEHEILEV